jgi:hypothetical protein
VPVIREEFNFSPNYLYVPQAHPYRLKYSLKHPTSNKEVGWEKVKFILPRNVLGLDKVRKTECKGGREKEREPNRADWSVLKLESQSRRNMNSFWKVAIRSTRAKPGKTAAPPDLSTCNPPHRKK